MADDGVAGLTMARLARAMTIQPPSLYKYYPSLLAVYDALFRRGQLANLQALRDGMRDAAPGLDAVAGAMEATGRWAAANPVLAQLLFWRPVPGYHPSAEAFGPALLIVDLLRGALADAAARGQIHPDAATNAGIGAAVDHALRDHQPAPGQRPRQRLGARPVHPPPPGNPRPVHQRIPAPDMTAVSTQSGTARPTPVPATAAPQSAQTRNSARPSA